MAAEDAGGDEQDQHHEHQRERARERPGEHVGVGLLDVVPDEQRQAGLVAVEGVQVEPGGEAGGEQHRGGLADAAGHAEHDGGGQPGAGGGQDDVPHGAPLAGAERVGRLLEGAGDEPDDDLRGPGDDRHHHDGEREGRREAALLHAEGEDDHAEDEQSGDDRRQGGHRLDQHPHRLDQAGAAPGLAGLDQEDGGEDAERDREQGGHADLFERADDRVQAAAGGDRVECGGAAHGLGEEVGVPGGVQAAQDHEADLVEDDADHQ
nr:hypothetical protein [Kitasatospora cheerisanensis]